MFSSRESCAMRAFLQQWSPLTVALLAVISIVYSGMALRKKTENVQERLTTLENNMVSIRDALEGSQETFSRITTLQLRVEEALKNLLQQRESAFAPNGEEDFNVQSEFQALKNNIDAVLNITQRIEYIEDMLLDIQESLEDIKKQQNRANQ
jgi:hypothetical protein